MERKEMPRGARRRYQSRCCGRDSTRDKLGDTARPWHQEKALPSSPGLPWGGGEGAAAAIPGAGRVTDGSPGQPGPAGFKVTCEAKEVGSCPSLPRGGETPQAPLHRLLAPPRTCRPPGKGTACFYPLRQQQLSRKGTVLPTPTHAPPRTPAPRHGHGYRLEGHLCSRRRS